MRRAGALAPRASPPFGGAPGRRRRDDDPRARRHRASSRPARPAPSAAGPRARPPPSAPATTPGRRPRARDDDDDDEDAPGRRASAPRDALANSVALALALAACASSDAAALAATHPPEPPTPEPPSVVAAVAEGPAAASLASTSVAGPDEPRAPPAAEPPDLVAAAAAGDATTTTATASGSASEAPQDPFSSDPSDPSSPSSSTALGRFAAAGQAFVKPLLSEFGAAVLGFASGAAFASVFMGWQQSRATDRRTRSQNRQALADLAVLDESEIQALVGELPAWLAFRDVERAGWLNKVLRAAWPYLDQATSDVIVNSLDPILRATRPSFLTTLSFERFSFGKIPARIEGVKVYESPPGDGSVEIDLNVFWAGDPDVVLGVRAARDRVSVPVSLTEFECAFTLRLIFAPLLGVFPCFGALTIALVDEPSVDFDLRVVGGDVTLVPGLRAPLRSYIKALVASWMVWPRCITVAIPGTGYELPGDAAERKPEIVGVLRVQVIGHQFVNNAGGGDARRDAEGEVGLQVRWPVAELAGVAGLGAGASEGKGPASQSEERVAALANGAGDPGEIALPVENPRAQLLCVRWYGRHADADGGAEGFLEGGDDLGEPGANASLRKKSAFDRLEGEASVTLETLVRQATAATRRPGEASFSSPTTTTEDVVSWGPVAVAAEPSLPPAPTSRSVRGASDERRAGCWDWGGARRGASAGSGGRAPPASSRGTAPRARRVWGASGGRSRRDGAASPGGEGRRSIKAPPPRRR